MKWSLPGDREVDDLAAEVSGRDDLSPSSLAAFHTLRAWDTIADLGLAVAVILFGVCTVASIGVFLILGTGGLVVLGSAAAFVASFGVNALWQRMQRALLVRLLHSGTQNDNVNALGPVLIPATRADDDT